MLFPYLSNAEMNNAQTSYCLNGSNERNPKNGALSTDPTLLLYPTPRIVLIVCSYRSKLSHFHHYILDAAIFASFALSKHPMNMWVAFRLGMMDDVGAGWVFAGGGRMTRWVLNA